ncbi:hypothetical protein Golob_000095, partial [Gossypium lobatum]|nr:hypothetical protein [Gossypium lobatum]
MEPNSSNEDLSYGSDNDRDQRINDNIPVPNLETVRSLEEHLRVLPSEMEIIKQEFEKRSL